MSRVIAMNNYQRLDRFVVPAGFRRRHALYVQLWWVVQASLFRWSPQFAYGFRRWLLRCFGATIGKNVVIRPSATITYPWNLRVGDYAWIGDDVVIYDLGEIDIGAHAVVSQRSYLCAGDHDSRHVDFPIRAHKVRIGEGSWIATDVFIGPGVTIGEGTIVGARSSVFKDLPGGAVCHGNPCKIVRERSMATP